MASNVTAQSVLGKISQGHLECSICCTRFKEPKILDCLHSFCLACLDSYRESQSPGKTMISCPLCRQETSIIDAGIAGLPNNFSLCALVEEVTMQEQLLEGQGSEIRCQACDEKAQAVSICMDCAHFLCLDCQKAHERLAVMKSHKIYTLTQLRSGEISYKSRLRNDVPKCDVHPEQNLSIYCSTCEKLLCITCSVLSHSNLQHTLIELSEALDKCKQDVADKVAQAEETKKKLLSIMDDNDKSRQALDTMLAENTEKISSKAEQKISEIRAQIERIQDDAQKLKEKESEIYQEGVKTYEKAQAANRKGVQQIEHKLEEAEKMVAQASCYEILELKQKLLNNLEAMSQVQPEMVPKKFSFTDYIEDEASLGQLVLECEVKMTSKAKVDKKSTPPRKRSPKENWKFKTEIKTQGSRQHKFGGVYHVAVFSNEEIVMVDYFFRKLISFLPKDKNKDTSRVISQELKIKDLMNPMRVAVNKKDHLIVLDGPTVKIFDRKFQLLHQFTAIVGTKITPTCLAVDEDDLIGVGYQEKEEVSLHNPDGTLIKMLYAPMIDDFLTTWKKRLIYTNYTQQKVLCVDYKGNWLFHVTMVTDHCKHRGPTGVCAVDDGSLYIAMHGTPSGEIHRLYTDGQYTKGIIKNCGFTHGITLTPTGDLVVAAADSVKIYQRV